LAESGGIAAVFGGITEHFGGINAFLAGFPQSRARYGGFVAGLAEVWQDNSTIYRQPGSVSYVKEEM
jgi:hypothetical protein